MQDLPTIPIFWGFVSFNPLTKLPEYSQYNFKFDTYKTDFNLNFDDKYSIFI